MADWIAYLPNHGFVNGDTVLIPALAQPNTVYYVIDKDQSSFKISLSDGGSALSFAPDLPNINGYTDLYVRQVDVVLGATTISGLDHLEGEDVYVTSGGSIVGLYTVSDGSITVPSDIYTYQVGLPYAMKLRTMRLAVPMRGNTLQGRIKRINETEIRYIRTIGGQAGQECDGVEHLEGMNAEFSTKSKDAQALTKGGYSKEGYTLIKSAEPYPMTILTIMVSFDVTEK